ncbi:glycosyltransferase [Larkinella sp. VNQ87]|uniref:glycosyltransferase n=1 Tax=Larkinella sp. VNQ87 TaxID=3400921 RepID=UPI003BFB89C3
MKIVLLCGSLEPGRNGVGDYARLLAGELVRMGLNVVLISMNDPFVKTPFFGKQYAEDVAITVLRIPADESELNRLKHVKDCINTFDPDWISLQFVPFSFHPKGLPVGLGKQLSKIGKGRRWHIMFHELWVRVEPGVNWKRRFYTPLQKALIKQLINTIKPSVVHTHLPSYFSDLQQIGCSVKPLPLFSNIIFKNSITVKKDPVSFCIGIFSQIDDRAEVLKFISQMSDEISKEGIRLELLMIGGDPNRMNKFTLAVSSLKNFTGKISQTGFLEPEFISLELQKCSLGITSVPRHLLGKSGSVAAFLSHGIPVAAPCFSSTVGPSEIGFFSEELKSAILLSPKLCAYWEAKSNVSLVYNSLQLQSIANVYALDLKI